MLHFSRHALKQMRRRGISRADVRNCLNNPYITVTPFGGCRLCFSSHPSGKRIKVVLDPKINKVVTAVLIG